jgi:aconitate decarboxylase
MLVLLRVGTTTMSQDRAGDNTFTSGIANFVAGLRYGDIPGEVKERIKFLILDSLGCAIFGTHLAWSRILIETLAKLDSTAGCRIWGSDKRLSAPHAVLVNGTLVQSFELDDVHRQGVLHVGAVTLPPLFAVAELKGGMTGRDFLTAAVAGYEVGPRVGMCMGQEHIVQGWHSGATVGVFSAAAGAAAALKLSPQQTVHALGIAGTQAAGLMAAQFGAMVKRMHAGRSAQSGFYAAILAENGFTGITDVFENPYGGFCTTFSRSTDRFNRDELVSGLGERFETMRISLKLYSCVSTNHTALDAIGNMQQRRAFGPKDVEKIIVRCSLATLEHAGWPYRPQGMTAAQLNLSYCIATLLLEGQVFVDQFSEALLADPARLALAGRIEVHEDPMITARGAKFRHMVRVEVHLTDGCILNDTVEAPRGSEHNFPSSADVVAKFTNLAGRAMPPAQVQRIAETVLDLDRLDEMGALVDALAPTTAD